jgi:hypothetical protein
MSGGVQMHGAESGSNVIRDTPGRLLMAWALLFSSLVLLSWRVHVHRSEYDWLEYPTALGDRAYYGTAVGDGLGPNDFFEANLKFEVSGTDFELFRRLHQPTRRRDVSMRKVARENTGRFYVYTDGALDEDGTKFFLKAGEDRYVTFGKRVFYPTFEETRSQ